MTNDVLLKTEVAKLLKRSTRTVERLVHDKLLGGPIRDTKPAKWKIGTVHRYMKANGIPIPAEGAERPTSKERPAQKDDARD
jgi:hypothetical protein